MKGLEMMLANLLGMKPEEMRRQVEQALNLMHNGASAMGKLQNDVDLIKKHLGIDENSTEVNHNVNGGTLPASRNSADHSHIQL